MNHLYASKGYKIITKYYYLYRKINVVGDIVI